eukprot:11165527-Lingulodinium_polyedra.AAC.1
MARVTPSGSTRTCGSGSGPACSRGGCWCGGSPPTARPRTTRQGASRSAAGWGVPQPTRPPA